MTLKIGDVVQRTYAGGFVKEGRVMILGAHKAIVKFSPISVVDVLYEKLRFVRHGK